MYTDSLIITVTEVLLESSMWRPEMVLNNLKFTKYSPQQITILPHKSVGPRLRNSEIKEENNAIMTNVNFLKNKRT